MMWRLLYPVQKSEQIQDVLDEIHFILTQQFIPDKISAPCDKPNIDDGTLSPSSATVSSGASYEVTCNDGFVISGPSTVTCTTGNLSELPTCEPGTCI